MKRWILILSIAVVAAVLISYAIDLGARKLQSDNDRQENDSVVCYEAWVATVEYMNAHHGHLPPASNWESALLANWEQKPRSYPFSVTLTPGAGGSGRRLAMNRRLSGADIRKIGIGRMGRTVLYYDVADTKQNAIGDPPWYVLSAPLDRPEATYVCLDGHFEAP